MKHYNSSLATAIMMALSLPASAQLANVEVGNAGIPSFVGDRAVRSVELPGGDNVMQPDARFDFGTGVTYIPTPAGGVIFATEIFGADQTLPEPYFMAAVYTVDTAITSDFVMTFTLDNGAQFANNPQLGVKDAGERWTQLIAPVSGGQHSDSVTFALLASSKPLASGDQLLLLYQLEQVGILKTAGEKINLTVSSNLADSSSQTTTVAQSAQAISAEITPNEVGKVYIAVASGSTQFSGKPVANDKGSFIDNYVAQIGTLSISTAGPQLKREDGVSPFVIGEGQVEAKGILNILGGQFQASKSLPGKVFLNSSATDTDFATTDFVTTDSAGSWNVTWNLDMNKLATLADSAAMANASSGDTAAVTGSATIRIRTDGVATVNTVSTPPQATLTLDFSDARYQDLTVAGNLRKITRNGIVCTVFNVPPPKAGVIGADTLAIRVTNNSLSSGKLFGKLYSQDGGDPIWSGDLTTEEVPAGATVRFTSEDVARVSGQTWDGRAILEISTIIPWIEVMPLIRQNGIRMAPLSNISEGVAPSCQGEE
jgi:hypothetical protein